jgi:bifunctional UDP-N-acetylglucosamine pyrophosphorylase / glucosamine-1-phosphate N-acetyltransferase
LTAAGQRDIARRVSRSTTAAIVLAAGRSVRFASARSKLLHPLSGKALIEWPLDALRALGAAPMVVVVGPDAAELRGACGDDVRFAVQRAPRGTGHAVLAARSQLASYRGPVLVMAGDLPLLRVQTLRRLLRAQRQVSDGIALLTARIEDAHGWGRIVRNGKLVDSIVEERDASPEQREIREVNVGVYCTAAPLLFDLLRKVRPDNVQGEIYLTDIVELALRRGGAVRAVPVDAAEVGQVNSRRELARLEAVLRRQINERWMAAGVTIVDPDTTYIGPQVRIGGDTFIGPNVHLRGATRIGADCRLDGSSYITDSVLGDRVHLRFGTVMTEAAVGRECVIGPFAHLRPATRLGPGVHIGDFVETKNASLAAGAKANHLAYIGDAEIGRDTNVGAGTITCNYDGFRKHRTVVGDRVQIGSDTQLVAPVRLGDDVYVASGSTVRHDVPAGHLVYNPRSQVEREGWVAVRRAREQAANGRRKR